ncbi:Propionate catabolism operon regulatory protein PrpR [uncultured delta proteobacterium]|uniref:Propionate catabolism operon regulatory protein PrpR n=1 Tax=uncultured delta proteobacterium TaxID=34034 RepID=A0A212JCT9_9DELT|nr:Propionate catabolism operon regulatory protein PrpR [uncultured delta proteobacterium]
MYNDGEPFAFSLIAPYGNMAALFAQYVAGLPCTLSVREGVALDEAPGIALQEIAEKKPDIIFSRGGTADYIRSAVDVPVVSIPTTAIDLLRTLQPFAGKVRKVAFFHYQQYLPEVQLVSRTLGIAIDEYVFHTKEELVSHMIEAKAKGAELTLGGILVVRMRDVSGLEGILVEAGEAAVQQAVAEAFSIARIRRVERQRQARMRTILDSVTESIIATDENNTLTLINPAAEKLLGVKAEDALGLDARSVVPNTRTAEVLRSGQAELNDIQDMGGTMIVTNRVPITVAGKTVGVVCTFNEADRIQRAEQNLRGSLRVKGFKTRYRLDDITTRDTAMLALKELAGLYAATDATILLEGESGTGKELFAQGIHSAGNRAKGPFVAVNCAAIPESLLESELFGYEEGAFTGAKRQGKSGFFEMAHKGTLFLDEVGELPLPIQARLLRVLQEREIIRVGGARVIPVDMRIICATNRDLAAWTDSGNFRQDLYYRLNVLPLGIPPLRERKEDIPLLAAAFLRANLPADFPFPEGEFFGEIAAALRGHDWPGNVRELRNVMERLAIAASVLPGKSLKSILSQVWTPVKRQGAPNRDIPLPEKGGLKEMTRAFEREAIRALLDEHGQNQVKVAGILGISRMSLWRKIQEDGNGPDGEA